MIEWLANPVRADAAYSVGLVWSRSPATEAWRSETTTNSIN